MMIKSCLNRQIYSTIRIVTAFHRHVSSTKSSIESTINLFTNRSHNCGQLTEHDVGKEVNLFGWVKYTQLSNKFIVLRDSYGAVQCIVDKEKYTKEFKKTNIHNESVLQISGVVRTRPDGQENKELTTGKIEVLANDVKVISMAKGDLPIISRAQQSYTLNNRLRYRYLDIRSSQMQEALRIRSEICHLFRDKLYEFGFVECETPTLFKRTPGGANEFVVPTQLEKKYYSLTQSPQQLKQLLMIGGLDRYFQICRCYRDESGRQDRQPEFTQLDLELSFTNQKLVMKLVNELLYHLFEKLSEKFEFLQHLKSSFDHDKQIKAITYQEAMDKYGSDKPDTRFAWLIEPCDNNKLCIKIPHVMDHAFVSCQLSRLSDHDKADLSKFNLRTTNTDQGTEITVDSNSLEAKKLLGFLRKEMAKDLENSGYTNVYDRQHGVLWVTDFPLFAIDKITGRIEPNHHPFTAPTDDTAQFLKTAPLSVIGQHYDLVLDGQEIAGGSIRIHDAQLQRQIFSEVLGLSEETFKYFIEALESGCPPHGGIAFGLDRLVAIILGRDTIRDVIAFPKSNIGRDLMSECPHEIDSDVKKMYHLT